MTQIGNYTWMNALVLGRIERNGMKRNPGEWLRRKLLDRIADATVLATFAAGWLCGGLAGMVTMELGAGWAILLVLIPGAATLGATLHELAKGWRLPHMRRGVRAEERVGQAIEYALTRERCAVAHNVQHIAKVGDIDHLVATPHGLWVIETKHGRLPSSHFQETLRRIALNVKGIRDWAPGMRVTGCLVFAGEQNTSSKPTYEWGAEKIRCFGNATELMREVKHDAHGEGGSSDVARKVWQLGKVGRR